MTLTFSKPISRLHQWVGVITASDGRTFKLKNRYYNAVFPSGHIISEPINMEKVVLDEAPGSATVLFERKGDSSNGSATSSPSTGGSSGVWSLDRGIVCLKLLFTCKAQGNTGRLEDMCAKLPQLVRSLTANQKVSGSILGLVEG